MRVAIVGSRRRRDRQSVVDCVAGLPADTVIVSGACRGPDRWAAAAAVALDMPVAIHIPDPTGVRCRGEAARRYHERNQRIVDDCARVIAFPAADRKGGTEDTIRRAIKAGKPVEIR